MNSLTISTGWGGEVGWQNTGVVLGMQLLDQVVGARFKSVVHTFYIYVHVEVTDLSELFILENTPTHDSTVSECGIFITKEQSF